METERPGEGAAAAAPGRLSWMPLWLRAMWVAGVLLIVFMSGVIGGMLLERDQAGVGVVLGPEWRDLGEVIDRVEQESYYLPDDPEERDAWYAEVEFGAIDGLLGATGDEWAAYLPPAEAAASNARLTGEYEGIGVSIAEGDTGEVEVVGVLLDSPASRANVRVGDVVAQVDATAIPTGDTELAAALLRGEAGTEVDLLLERDGSEPLELDLTREVVETGEKTVLYRYLPESGIGVIQMTLFATTTQDELDEALAQAEADGVTRLVLDLRGNPGGWVSAAQGTLGRFLPTDTGPALLEDTRARRGTPVELPITGSDSPAFTGDLVVLVDGGTASAAEIVAAALQDYDRATVIGVGTFGKGSVQRVFDFPDGESLRISIAEWFSPERRPLQGEGVTPDIEVDATASVDALESTFATVFSGELPMTGGTPVASPAAVPAATPD